MRSRWRSVVTVLALSLAACGGGGGESEDAVGPAPATGRVADEARARTIVLQQADMPAGWRGSAHNEDPRERDRARELARCLGRPDPEGARSAIAYGADLSMGQMQVSSIATVVSTVEDARGDLEAVRGPKYGECVAAAFRDSLRQQAGEARVEDVAAEPLPVEDFGDGSVGVRLTASLVYPDRTDRLFADLVYISKERATVSATFFSFHQPFPATLQQSLVSRMGNRIETA
ncbi:MAG TPA: hypothetical protein VHF27_05350 [Acidimicrobiales bacterium]|nr:hypothetical protein [Acidimicrobiales bacterium]